jgi:hypothetical protein
MTCPVEPLPQGWRVWRGAVPPELSAVALDVLHNVRAYPRGSIAKSVDYKGQAVGAFVSSHTWTYRNGQLVTGLCIPGVSLVFQPQTMASGVATHDSLENPDPTAAVFVDLGDAPSTIDWPLVAVSAGVIVIVVTLFALALHHGGRAALSR